MNGDLAALAAESTENKSLETDGGVDISALMRRFNSIESKLDKLIELSSKDVSIDESNNEKVSVSEAEGKINEVEEYRNEDDKKGD